MPAHCAARFDLEAIVEEAWNNGHFCRFHHYHISIHSASPNGALARWRRRRCNAGSNSWESVSAMGLAFEADTAMLLTKKGRFPSSQFISGISILHCRWLASPSKARTSLAHWGKFFKHHIHCTIWNIASDCPVSKNVSNKIGIHLCIWCYFGAIPKFLLPVQSKTKAIN